MRERTVRSTRAAAAVAELGSLGELPEAASTLKARMKTYLSVTFVGLLMCFHSFADELPFKLNITQAGLQTVLPLYRDISGLELIVSSHVKHVFADITVDCPPTKALSKEDAMKLIETALIQQAGIVISRLDDKKASVTYNDALKVAKKDAKK